MTISGIILRALKKIVHLLEKENLPYCLFGGLAMQVYKRIRATKDIDLMILVNENKIPKLIENIEKAGFKFDREKGIIKINGFELLRFVYLDEITTFEIFIDLVTVTTEFQKEVIKRKTRLDFLGIKINIASLEDLILLKLLSNRSIDRLDAQYLYEENKEVVNEVYLKSWAEKLKIENDLKDILKQNA